MISELFENLFVLELANNHWGKLERGLEIIRQYSEVIHTENIKASIKLQFRDVDTFIHKDFRSLTNYRYITKTLATKMASADIEKMVDEIKRQKLITMATPFDEKSVELCQQLNLDIIKIASSDINDRILVEAIAKTNTPVIVSTGGASLEDIEKVVTYFNEKEIPLAVNHCVAQYPTEKENLDLAQIDFLKKLFPKNIIGLSTHERNEDLSDTIMMAYAAGARTYERHIDIPNNEHPVSPYCSLPTDIVNWIHGWKKAVKIYGQQSSIRRKIPLDETIYLNALVRGVYARKPLKKGKRLSLDDVYFAIPVQKGQLSCREFDASEVLLTDIEADKPLLTSNCDAPYLDDEKIALIKNRGL
ncbi:MAG: N-acetylneuraminate synthase family protein [Alphaproteobacteria bacterium]|nr:N-acetylneuraminate synthase family protein [Alphaproteobacteria bacterium]